MLIRQIVINCEYWFLINYLLEILCFNDFSSDAVASKEFFFDEYLSPFMIQLLR